MPAALLLNLPAEAEAPKGPGSGPGSTSGGKLPEAVRLALLGGDYDAGALRLEVELVPPQGARTALVAGGHVTELGTTPLTVFGAHPVELEELEGPEFVVEVLNPAGKFTQGNPAGVLPNLSLAGYALEVTVQEFLTDPDGGAVIFRQSFALLDVTQRQDAETVVARFFSVHPLVGWLANQWSEADSWDVDWAAWPHEAR